MAEGAERSTGPMVANDALVASMVENLDLFEEAGSELVVTNLRFQTAGPQKVAIIIPKGGELDLITVLPGEEVIRIESANGAVHVNPNIITEKQAATLLETRKVRQVILRISPGELRELAKTINGGTE